MTDTKDRLAEALRAHRLQDFFTDDGAHLPLIDHLSAGDTIASGEAEIQRLVDTIEAAHDAQRAESGAGVPDGYVLVPREPTSEMLDSVKDMTFSVRVAEDDSAEYPASEDDCDEIYRNMIAAAPEKDRAEKGVASASSYEVPARPEVFGSTKEPRDGR